MSWYQILYLSSLIIIPILGYLFKTLIGNHMQRIDNLEQNLLEKISETQVRVLMQDKLDPIKEDLIDINNKINKVLDHLLKQ